MRIIVTPTSFKSPCNHKAKKMLESFADEIIYNDTGKPVPEDELITLAKNSDGIIAGLDTYGEKFFDSVGNRLKVISRYGVGLDRVNLKAAKEKNIIVTNTPGVNSDAVADLTMGLIINVARKICVLNSEVKSGNWPRTVGIELPGKTLGILGLGSIGKKTAQRAKGFSMNIIAYDPYFDDKFAKRYNILKSSFNDVIEKSDFIAIHLPLAADTGKCINSDVIDKMKDGVILINTSRGGIIDENALYEKLLTGKVAGAGLDAFETEPPDNKALIGLSNVIVTPHSGAHTDEAALKMAELSVCNLISVLQGKKCINKVN